MEALRHYGARNLAAGGALILALSLMLGVVCFALYNSAKESISLRGQLNAAHYVEEFNRYLSIGTNSVSLAASELDGMLKDKATPEALLTFLTEETGRIQGMHDIRTTGLYGWIAGTYLDGGGWVPEEGYNPLERPWYKGTAAPGKVNLIRPYLDQQTGSYIMTVTQRLSDGVSVVALDFSLDRLQELSLSIARSASNSVGMVLDPEGNVVAHSVRYELGVNYLAEEGTLGAIIARKLLLEGQTQFEVRLEKSHYMVSCAALEGGWYSVSALNTADYYGSLRVISFISVLFILMTILALVSMLLRISTRQMLADTLNTQLETVAERYLAMRDIDLMRDTYRVLNCGHGAANAFGEEEPKAQSALLDLLRDSAEPSSLGLMESFADFRTLDERLRNHHSITEEYLTVENTWCRARFVVAERTRYGEVARVLWIVEDIDGEKRHADNLLFLSETDRMTGLKNRGGGENAVTTLMTQGASGMFLLMDADKFKSVNDTYGHQVGDKVLVTIADCMRKTFRTSDVLLRLGGDEFAVYALGITDSDLGRSVVGRFFARLEGTVIEEMGDKRIHMSVGAAFFTGEEKLSFHELYQRADKGTYESKKYEGNHICFYDAESDEVRD